MTEPLDDIPTSLSISYSGDEWNLTRECDILRYGDNRRSEFTIRFKESLSPTEFSMLSREAARNHSADDDVTPPVEEDSDLAPTVPRVLGKGRDLACRDRGVVIDELRNIKSCRSSIFISTVGALTTLTMGIWALAVQGYVDMGAVSCVMGILLFVFLIGALSIAEKARAINLREGFICALDRELQRNDSMPSYKGWVSLKVSLSDCGVAREAGFCKRAQRCRHNGNREAAGINEAKCLWPGTIRSFMTLCSIVYFVCFILITALACVSLGTVLARFSGMNPNKLYFWFGIGFLASRVAWMQPRFSILPAIFGFFVSAGIGLFAKTDEVPWIFNAAIAGVLMGSIALYLLRQLYEIRAGKYSVDTYCRTWIHVLKDCPAGCAYSFEPPKGKIPWNRTALLWVLGRKSHYSKYKPGVEDDSRDVPSA